MADALDQYGRDKNGNTELMNAVWDKADPTAAVEAALAKGASVYVKRPGNFNDGGLKGHGYDAFDIADNLAVAEKDAAKKAQYEAIRNRIGSYGKAQRVVDATQQLYNSSAAGTPTLSDDQAKDLTAKVTAIAEELKTTALAEKEKAAKDKTFKPSLDLNEPISLNRTGSDGKPLTIPATLTNQTTVTNNTEALDKLVAGGADINKVNAASGNNSLLMASRNENVTDATLKHVTEIKGVNLNVRDASNNTAAMLTAQMGSVDKTKVMIGAKADLTLKNDGKTAFDFAKEAGDKEDDLAQKTAFEDTAKALKDAEVAQNTHGHKKEKPGRSTGTTGSQTSAGTTRSSQSSSPHKVAETGSKGPNAGEAAAKDAHAKIAEDPFFIRAARTLGHSIAFQDEHQKAAERTIGHFFTGTLNEHNHLTAQQQAAVGGIFAGIDRQKAKAGDSSHIVKPEDLANDIAQHKDHGKKLNAAGVDISKGYEVAQNGIPATQVADHKAHQARKADKTAQI